MTTALHRLRASAHLPDQPYGFTLVELLVSIAVIGLLLALLTPAIQAAREMSRKASCQNNLKQIGLAALNHESTHGRLPSDGWGYAWVGEPDRGSDKRQPGGWAFNLLGDLDQSNLALTQSKLCQTGLPVFRCPSRPGDLLGSQLPQLNGQLRNMVWHPRVAKGDYAINGGDVVISTPDSPQTLGEGDNPSYPWVDTTSATGVGFLRSEVRIADITDGTSNTYLVGEKMVSRIGYSNSADPGHDQCFFCGVDWDNTRWSVEPPLADSDSPDPLRFGSAHVNVFHVVMCDGSIRAVSYHVDHNVHRNHGNRRDGTSVQ